MTTRITLRGLVPLSMGSACDIRPPLFCPGFFPISLDRSAHVRERLATDALRACDFRAGPRAIAFFVEQLAGELRLQRDSRQRIAEQVVQIIRDAFALSAGC